MDRHADRHFPPVLNRGHNEHQSHDLTFVWTNNGFVGKSKNTVCKSSMVMVRHKTKLVIDKPLDIKFLVLSEILPPKGSLK